MRVTAQDNRSAPTSAITHLLYKHTHIYTNCCVEFVCVCVCVGIALCVWVQRHPVKPCRPWVTEIQVLPFWLQLSSLLAAHLTLLNSVALFHFELQKLCLPRVSGVSCQKSPVRLLGTWQLRWWEVMLFSSKGISNYSNGKQCIYTL